MGTDATTVGLCVHLDIVATASLYSPGRWVAVRPVLRLFSGVLLVLNGHCLCKDQLLKYLLTSGGSLSLSFFPLFSLHSGNGAQFPQNQLLGPRDFPYQFLPFLPSFCSTSNVSHNSLFLSTQVEPSAPTKTGAKPGQVCRQGGKAGHFPNQRSSREAATLIRIPDTLQAFPDRAWTWVY